MARVFALRGNDWRMLPISANGQPALVAYCRDEDGAHHLHTLQVFTVKPAGITHNMVFQDTRVFAAFDLPAVLGPATPPTPQWAALRADRSRPRVPAGVRLRAVRCRPRAAPVAPILEVTTPVCRFAGCTTRGRPSRKP
jgi:hypothetical protein